MDKIFVLSVSNQAQATYDAWGLDSAWDDYIYYAWYEMYSFTIIPSVNALQFIMLLKIHSKI